MVDEEFEEEERLSRADEAFKDFQGFTDPRPKKGSKRKNFFAVPNEWITISAFIDNLAEMKVVEYIMRHTWGFQEYEGARRITTDEFMHGRIVNDERIDCGTRLSKQSVITGIKKALKHGLIVEEIDDHDQARVKKYYKLRVWSEEGAEEIPEEEEEIDVKDLDSGVKDLDISGCLNVRQRSKKDKRNSEERNIIRIPSTQKNDQETIRGQPSGKRDPIPEFIRRTIEDYSRDLGDYEHTGSNISQTFRIYQESEADPTTFQQAMQEAKEIAQKKAIKKLNSQGRPNRMPYFFRCLRQIIHIEQKTREG